MNTELTMTAIEPESPPPPWYRQFWPWVLIGLPGSVVIASFITLYIAIKYSDDIVADNYYKDGLAINTDLSADARARELGLRAAVQLDAAQKTMTVTLDGNLAPPPAQFSAHFIHPVSADNDLAVPLLRSIGNTYVARLPRALAGRWTIELSDPRAAWRLRGQTLLGADRSAFELSP